MPGLILKKPGTKSIGTSMSVMCATQNVDDLGTSVVTIDDTASIHECSTSLRSWDNSY